MKKYIVEVHEDHKIWKNEQGQYHREDGPAIEYANGNKEWWFNGQRHREDGPAVEWVDGVKEWFLNDKLHREDGPAIEWDNGDKEWWFNGQRHREDGPAIERVNGNKTWYLNGEHLTEEEFNERMNQYTVEKACIDEGDTLVVTLSKHFNVLPPIKFKERSLAIKHLIEHLHKDNNVKVIVVPYGTKIEILKTCEF